MRDLHTRIDALVRRRRLPWTRNGNRIAVRLGESGRSQVVRFGRIDSVVWFESTVVDASLVTAEVDSWRMLAVAAWARNAVPGLVGFAFDDDDRLVGRVEYPWATLDDEEISVCVAEVAAECDRFEAGWRGEDEE